MDLNEAQGWRPQEGDTLIGTVSEVSRGWSDYSKGYYPIITVDPEGDGDPVAVHCFHAALSRRVLELRPQVGERIGIAYKGQRQHKTNEKQSVSVYVVKVERDTPRAVDDLYASMDDPEPAQAAVPTSDVPDDDIPF